MRRRTWWQRGVLTAVICLVVAVLCQIGPLRAPLLHVAETFGRLRPETVLLVLLLTALSTLLSGGLWCRILSQMHCGVPASAGLGAFAGTGLASYVANAASSTVGGVVWLRRYGVCAGRAAIVTLAANALGLCGVLLWAPVGLIMISRPEMRHALPFLGSHDLAVAAAAVVGLTIGIVVALWILASAERVGGKLAKLPWLRARVHKGARITSSGTSLRAGHFVTLVPLSAISWLAGTLALYAMLVGLEPGAGIDVTDVIGASALAGVFGSLAFFVPSGVGVRDGVLITLLAHATGAPLASCAAAALTMRALDPLSKISLLVLLASGLGSRCSTLYQRSLGLFAFVFPRVADQPRAYLLARLATRMSEPIREVVRVESTYRD